jgi:hypothetical protein
MYYYIIFPLYDLYFHIIEMSRQIRTFHDLHVLVSEDITTFHKEISRFYKTVMQSYKTEDSVTTSQVEKGLLAKIDKTKLKLQGLIQQLQTDSSPQIVDKNLQQLNKLFTTMETKIKSHLELYQALKIIFEDNAKQINKQLDAKINDSRHSVHLDTLHEKQMLSRGHSHGGGPGELASLTKAYEEYKLCIQEYKSFHRNVNKNIDNVLKEHNAFENLSIIYKYIIDMIEMLMKVQKGTLEFKIVLNETILHSSLFEMKKYITSLVRATRLNPKGKQVAVFTQVKQIFDNTLQTMNNKNDEITSFQKFLEQTLIDVTPTFQESIRESIIQVLEQKITVSPDMYSKILNIIEKHVNSNTISHASAEQIRDEVIALKKGKKNETLNAALLQAVKNTKYIPPPSVRASQVSRASQASQVSQVSQVSRASQASQVSQVSQVSHASRSKSKSPERQTIASPKRTRLFRSLH